MKTHRKPVTVIALLLAGMSAAAGETPAATPAAPKDIKSYSLDFNWGPGGPNGFAKPGHWAEADPAQHVAWYRALGPMPSRPSASPATATPGIRTASCRSSRA